jgi:hypothetical protein
MGILPKPDGFDEENVKKKQNHEEEQPSKYKDIPFERYINPYANES